MKIEYEVTRKDYIAVIKNELKQNKTSLACILIALPILLVFLLEMVMALSEESNMPIRILLFLLLIVAAIIITIKNKSIIAAITYRSRLKSGVIDRQYIGIHTLELGEENIKLSYDHINGERIYSGISRIHDENNLIIIYVGGNIFDIIPNTAFANKENKCAFLNFLVSKIKTTQNAVLNAEELKEKIAGADYNLEYVWTQDTFVDSMISGTRMFYKTRLMWTASQIIRILISLGLLYLGIKGVYEAVSYTGEGVPISNINVFELLMAVALQANLITTFTPLMKNILDKQIYNGMIPRDSIGKQILCINNDKLALYKRASSGELNMKQVYCLRQDNKYLYIIFRGKKFLTVPLSAFQSEAQIQEVVEYINVRIEK